MFFFELTKIVRFGFLKDRSSAGIVCGDRDGREVLLSIPMSFQGEFFAAYQAACKTTSEKLKSKLDTSISTALVAESIQLGRTHSGQVGLRMHLSNGNRFDLVMSKGAADQLIEAVVQLSEYRGAGGSPIVQ